MADNSDCDEYSLKLEDIHLVNTRHLISSQHLHLNEVTLFNKIIIIMLTTHCYKSLLKRLIKTILQNGICLAFSYIACYTRLSGQTIHFFSRLDLTIGAKSM